MFKVKIKDTRMTSGSKPTTEALEKGAKYVQS